MPAEKNEFLLLKPLNIISLAPGEETHWLGRIVRNFANPSQGFAPPAQVAAAASIVTLSGTTSNTVAAKATSYASPLFEGTDFSKSLFSSLSAMVKKSRSGTVRATLLGLLGGENESTSELEAGFESESKPVTQYRLNNSDNILTGLLAPDATFQTVKGSMPRALSREPPVCMIEGFLVASGGKVSSTETSEKRKAFDAEIPPELIVAVTTAAATGGFPLPLPVDGLGGVGGGSSRERGTETKVHAAPDGRHIFAIRYRTLRRSMLSRARQGIRLDYGPQGERVFTGDSTQARTEGEVKVGVELGPSPGAIRMMDEVEEMDGFDFVFESTEDDSESSEDESGAGIGSTSNPPACS